MGFTEIWNEAYNTFCEGDDCLMWDYLREQIKDGNISADDAADIAEDVIDTYNL